MRPMGSRSGWSSARDALAARGGRRLAGGELGRVQTTKSAPALPPSEGHDPRVARHEVPEVWRPPALAVASEHRAAPRSRNDAEGRRARERGSDARSSSMAVGPSIMFGTSGRPALSRRTLSLPRVSVSAATPTRSRSPSTRAQSSSTTRPRTFLPTVPDIAEHLALTDEARMPRPHRSSTGCAARPRRHVYAEAATSAVSGRVEHERGWVRARASGRLLVVQSGSPGRVIAAAARASLRQRAVRPSRRPHHCRDSS
jgi:hypothetical protein